MHSRRGGLTIAKCQVDQLNVLLPTIRFPKVRGERFEFLECPTPAYRTIFLRLRLRLVEEETAFSWLYKDRSQPP